MDRKKTREEKNGHKNREGEKKWNEKKRSRKGGRLRFKRGTKGRHVGENKRNGGEVGR